MIRSIMHGPFKVICYERNHQYADQSTRPLPVLSCSNALAATFRDKQFGKCKPPTFLAWLLEKPPLTFDPGYISPQPSWEFKQLKHASESGNLLQEHSHLPIKSPEMISYMLLPWLNRTVMYMSPPISCISLCSSPPPPPHYNGPCEISRPRHVLSQPKVKNQPSQPWNKEARTGDLSNGDVKIRGYCTQGDVQFRLKVDRDDHILWCSSLFFVIRIFFSMRQ